MLILVVMKKGGVRLQKEEAHTDGECIMNAIKEIQGQLACAKQGFEQATNDALIDGYIYEIIALQKKYEYFIKEAKEMGLTARKIG